MRKLNDIRELIDIYLDDIEHIRVSQYTFELREDSIMFKNFDELYDFYMNEGEKHYIVIKDNKGVEMEINPIIAKKNVRGCSCIDIFSVEFNELNYFRYETQNNLKRIDRLGIKELFIVDREKTDEVYTDKSARVMGWRGR